MSRHLPVILPDPRQIVLFEDKTCLPTGKNHVSFSEVNVWNECSWRHKLQYVDKLEEEGGSEHLVYGSEIHSALEEMVLNLKNSSFYWEDRVELAQLKIKEAFTKLAFTSERMEEDWIEPVRDILSSVPLVSSMPIIVVGAACPSTFTAVATRIRCTVHRQPFFPERRLSRRCRLAVVPRFRRADQIVQAVQVG